MAQYQGAFSTSREAAADLSTRQFRFVKFDGNDRALLGITATDPIQGILQNKPKALGKASRIFLLGAGSSKLVVKTSSAGNIAAGDKLTCTTDGRGEKANNAADGTFVTAMQGATADDTEIEVRLDVSADYDA